MKLTTLLSHTAQLIGFIHKSGMPSDTVASNYFRSKKYIGSKERRFISELVFLALRNKYLCDYCFDKAFLVINDYSDVSEPQNEKQDFGCVLTAFYMSSKFTIDNNFNADTLFAALPEQKDGSLNDSIKNSVCEFFEISPESADNFINRVDKIFPDLENDISTKIEGSNFNDEFFSLLEVRYSMKSWIIKQLMSYVGKDGLTELLTSLNQSAQLTVRLNTINNTRDDFVKYLNSIDIPSEKCNLSPSGIKILKRVQLSQYDFFKNGIIEVQDEGSQLISFALAPVENSRILDACAGAGGKTLHISSLTNDKSYIMAFDIDSRKLRELEYRAKKFGYKSIKTRTVRIKDISENILVTKELYDYVLVDAPCSGTGTIRRSPMNKYKLNENLLQRLKENQLRILNYYSKFVADGGVLVYSTCSFMPQENQEVVKEFLDSNTDFEPCPLSDSFEKYSIEISGLGKDDYFINLLPSVHGTDGFFIAKMRRKS
ncbi:MAG: methyltransferase domain-containing protein [bacterium]